MTRCVTSGLLYPQKVIDELHSQLREANERIAALEAEINDNHCELSNVYAQIESVKRDADEYALEATALRLSRDTARRAAAAWKRIAKFYFDVSYAVMRGRYQKYRRVAQIWQEEKKRNP